MYRSSGGEDHHHKSTKKCHTIYLQQVVGIRERIIFLGWMQPKKTYKITVEFVIKFGQFFILVVITPNPLPLLTYDRTFVAACLLQCDQIAQYIIRLQI